MDWPSVAVGSGATLAMVLLGASPLLRFTWNHRLALVAEIEKERKRRVTAERSVADLLESIETMHESLTKSVRELAICLRDLVALRAENQCLRRDASLRNSGGAAT